MVPICQRSIGVQVNLCKCPSNVYSPQACSTKLRKDLYQRMATYSKEDKEYHSEGAESLVWKNKSRHSSSNEEPDKWNSEERKISSTQQSRTGSVHFSPCESPSSQTPISPPPRLLPEEHQESQPMTPSDPLPKRDHSHSYHFKRKLANFRSDSVFSDVMPMASAASSCQEPCKSSDSDGREKSGSLSSLKPRESKWTSLRKKLGKINSSTTKKSLECKQSNPTKSIGDKRTLLQRAKTLSILPVKSSKEREEQPKKPARERKPRAVEEMFNVGGEMNMIPLELLIDINDLNISK